MDNYKVEMYDPVTMTSKGNKESEIPVVLLEAVRQGLQSLDTEALNYVITPVMANPNLKELSFGVLEKVNENHQFKFVVSIQTKEYWDEIYNLSNTVKYEKVGNG